ncbi:hypothetical protein OUZ56_003197 [Daphnia magna]|uniref:Uncharacterized protein n=1 Tax=Daphnia magna TaxID=35525 RepID=A0ABR0A897_9CRUS|nr:hypothetical protein OUZ56_003197 [Daphnia magna]
MLKRGGPHEVGTDVDELSFLESNRKRKQMAIARWKREESSQAGAPPSGVPKKESLCYLCSRLEDAIISKNSWYHSVIEYNCISSLHLEFAQLREKGEHAKKEWKIIREGKPALSKAPSYGPVAQTCIHIEYWLFDPPSGRAQHIIRDGDIEVKTHEFDKKYKLVVDTTVYHSHIEYKCKNSWYHSVLTLNTINGASPSWS